MTTSVFGLASSRQQAVDIVSRLKAARFPDNDISVLLPDKEGTRQLAMDNNTKAPEGAATGATAGGVLGGTVGLLAGIGALAIPGLGPFIAAGPILAALSGAAVGAAVGGLTGALIGMGIPEYEAKHYETRLKAGHALIAVHVPDNDREKEAKRILQEGGAEDVKSSSDAKGDKDDTRTPTIETRSTSAATRPTIL